MASGGGLSNRLGCSGYVGWRAVVCGVPAGYSGPWLSETWGRGGRFGIAPTGGDRTYWYASANLPSGAMDDPVTRQQQLLDRFAEWHRPIAQLIARTPPADILFTPIHDRAPEFRLTGARRELADRCIFLGDAAHPLTPNLGQGACLAMEDAAELAAVLPVELHDLTRLRAAWAEYTGKRQRRARAIWRVSRWVGRLVQCEQPVLCHLRDGWMAATPGWVHDQATRWIFRP